jgi:alcohol dehydrogenase class IV
MSVAAQESGISFQHIGTELRLYCGEESLAALGKELKRNGCTRAVVVSGRSVSATPAMDVLRAALGPLLVAESRSVRPNSPVPAVEETAAALREHRADAVIAVGGGSAAVTARAAAILLAEQKPARELCTRRLPNGQFDSPRLEAPKLPQFVIPTTPSTAFVKAGSAVHDDASGERLALFDPKTRAKALFLHPAFLRTAPAELVREAALNTLSTGVEALESPKCDPVSEAQLMQALRLLARNLDRVGPADVAAREYLAVAAVLCGRGTEQAGGGLSSVLAHAIGHRAHVSNGIVNAIVLPHTMRFTAPVTGPTAPRIAEGLQHGGSAAAADAVAELLATLPIPHRLRDIGIAESDLDPIARAAMGDFFITRSARRVQGVEDVRGILAAAW